MIVFPFLNRKDNLNPWHRGTRKDEVLDPFPIQLTLLLITYSWTMRFLRTLPRKFSNTDFFLKILPLKDDELTMSEI